MLVVGRVVSVVPANNNPEGICYNFLKAQRWGSQRPGNWPISGPHWWSGTGQRWPGT